MSRAASFKRGILNGNGNNNNNNNNNPSLSCKHHQQQTSLPQLRYENELKSSVSSTTSVPIYNNNNNNNSKSYYTLGCNISSSKAETPLKAATPASNPTSTTATPIVVPKRQQLYASSQHLFNNRFYRNGSIINPNNLINQQQHLLSKPTGAAAAVSTTTGATTGGFLRTFSFRNKPSSDEIFSSLPCLNAANANGRTASSSSSSLSSSPNGSSPPASVIRVGRPGQSSTGSNSVTSGSHNSLDHTSSDNHGHAHHQLKQQAGRDHAHHQLQQQHQRNNHTRQHGLSMTPTSSSLVLNSLAYQVLPIYSGGGGGGFPNPSSSNNNNNNYNKSEIATTATAGIVSQTSFTKPNKVLNHDYKSRSANIIPSNPAISVLNSSSGGSLSAYPSPNLVRKRPVADDLDGHLAYLPGDVLADRYEIVSTLGEGTFGKVAKVRDRENNAHVALKIIKNIHKYREAAKLEINVLKKLNAKDPQGRALCVRMFDSFNYYGHMCLTFEVLGESVFDFLKSNGYVSYPLEQVRHISHQLAFAVSFMHENKVII